MLLLLIMWCSRCGVCSSCCYKVDRVASLLMLEAGPKKALRG